MSQKKKKSSNGICLNDSWRKYFKEKYTEAFEHKKSNLCITGVPGEARHVEREKYLRK